MLLIPDSTIATFLLEKYLGFELQTKDLFGDKVTFVSSTIFLTN
jgi:hypothetical protein